MAIVVQIIRLLGTDYIIYIYVRVYIYLSLCLITLTYIILFSSIVSKYIIFYSFFKSWIFKHKLNDF